MFVFTIKGVCILLMVREDDMLIHGWVHRCDYMNIHQHKSTGYTWILTQDKYVFMPFWISYCVACFCRDYLFACISVLIVGKNVLVLMNQYGFIHVFMYLCIWQFTYMKYTNNNIFN